ncbi:uncharacterized protein LOC105843108 [Hydra vulgaris]|uniref:uncharacterized protein LOC105843108 n=1 Tax=Hydra vulgaris TaxID=6087 RepID=UPI001F5E87D1|nr:uncharacterized protein LOC105843108 [Hydra vulgaris]
MFIKTYIILFSIIILLLLQGSLADNKIPTTIRGYFDNWVTIFQPSNMTSCIQGCWNKIESGSLYEGALRYSFDSFCYCTVTQIGLTFLASNIHQSQSFLFSIFQPESATCSIGSNINFRVRISFYLESNDESTMYFIDSLSNPLTYSGRIIITNFVDLKRGFHQSITTERHNESKLYNLVKETYTGTLDTKFENFYSLIAKIGDMSVVDNHTEWAVMVYSNNNSLWVTLNPFVIQRSIKTCRLLMAVSNSTINQSLFINFNMTTSADCVVDLENVSILMQHHLKLKVARFVWDDLSINATSLINNINFDQIYVRKLYIDSFLKFTVIYETDRSPPFLGRQLISVITTITCTQYSDDKSNRGYKKLIFTTVSEKLQATTKIYPALTMENSKKFENKTHMCICTLIKNRQQSPCYQQEKRTGKIIFLPIQVSEVLGYDPLTNLLYGKMFREQIAQLNIYSNNSVFIITQDKWLTILSSLNFQNTETI